MGGSIGLQALVGKHKLVKVHAGGVHQRPRNGDRFVELRKGFFPDGNFPASAMITVSHFARPGMLIEIQGVAVIGG